MQVTPQIQRLTLAAVVVIALGTLGLAAYRTKNDDISTPTPVMSPAPSTTVAPDITVTPGTSIGLATSPSMPTSETKSTEVPASNTTVVSANTPQRVLARVRERKNGQGELICGVTPLLGFSQPPKGQSTDFVGFDHDYGDYSGFEADYCKIIATTLFMTYTNHVRFIPVAIPSNANPNPANERFQALAQGAIDVLFRHTSWTAQFDTTEQITNQNIKIGFDYGPVIYYDAQRFLIPTQSDRVKPTLDDLSGKEVCVIDGSRNYAQLPQLTSKVRAGFRPIIPKRVEVQDLVNGLKDGTCSAVTADDSRLRADFKELIDTNQYTIIDQEIARTALAPVVVEDDSEWRDLVSYAIYATIYADELDVTSNNVDSLAVGTSDVTVKRLLGVEEAIGPSLGIDAKFAAHIIKSFGNYSQIFDRNLTDIFGGSISIEERGPNRPVSKFGDLIAPPF